MKKNEVVCFVVEEINFKKAIEELKELRGTRYGKEEIRIISIEKNFYTSKY